MKSFDRLRTNGNGLTPLVVSLSNYERNQLDQSFLNGIDYVEVKNLYPSQGFRERASPCSGTCLQPSASQHKPQKMVVPMGAALAAQIALISGSSRRISESVPFPHFGLTGTHAPIAVNKGAMSSNRDKLLIVISNMQASSFASRIKGVKKTRSPSPCCVAPGNLLISATFEGSVTALDGLCSMPCFIPDYPIHDRNR